MGLSLVFGKVMHSEKQNIIFMEWYHKPGSEICRPATHRALQPLVAGTLGQRDQDRAGFPEESHGVLDGCSF